MPQPQAGLWSLGVHDSGGDSETGHFDHEPVAHIALQHPLVGSVDVVHRDQFDVRYETMLGAEVEHFLRLANAADEGTGDAAAP